MHAAIDRVLADNAEALKLLHEGAAIPRSRYPIDLSRGTATLLPHLQELRNGANLLRAEAMARLADGRPEAAAESIEAMLGLARSLKDEPVLVSQLVRRALHNLALDTLDRLLTHTEPPDATLSDLQQAFAAAETPGMMGRTIAAERIYAMNVFNENAAQASSLGTTRWDTKRVKMIAHRYSGLLTLDRLACLDVMSRMVEAAEKPLTERTAAMEQAEKTVRNLPFYAEVTPSVVPSIARAVEIDVRMIARLRAARTALAVERYRQANDRLPKNLDALTPEFIDAVPADPFTGDPLKYRKLDTGFTVYSVNKDGTDDGGKEPGEDDAPFEPGTDVPFTLRR